ncbi:ABC transporter substrate-binding protein [Streptomyces violascens]|uniref:ABC transporter substrate-binding protein n=1 Tax=Streptomyces violascens TaxID=67381 RepID=UPI00368C103E
MSRSWTRSTSTLVGTATALAVLTACGGGDSKSGDAGKGTADKPVTITFWAWQKGSKDVVDAFNASHKNIRVKFEEIPSGNAGGYAKISNAVKAGNAPDLVTVEYPMLPEFVSQGSFQDISKYVTDDVKKQFLPQSIQQTTLGGKNWAIPFDAAPQAYFYRKDFFEKNRIEVPKTWDDFKAAAHKAKAADPKARIGTFFPDDPTTFEAMAWQAGAQWFKTDGDTWKLNTADAATNKVAGYWQGLIDDRLVQNAVSFSPEWTASLKDGSTVGYLGASWGAGVLKGTVPDQSGKWAVAPVPTWDGKPASGMLGGSTWAVTKGSTKTEAALEFAQWMSTTPEGIDARIKSGTSSAFPADIALRPTAKKAFDTSFYTGQDIYRLFDAAGGSINANWGWGPSMGTTNTTLKDQLGKVAGGSVKITDAIRAAHDATVTELKKRGLKVEG